MSKHKYINYFITFMSLAIVFYYFANSISKSIKNQEDVIEEFTISVYQEDGILDRIKNIENRIFKRYYLDKDSTQLENCEKGRKIAIKDAKNKTYKLHTFGSKMAPITEKIRFDGFYEGFLKSKYGISTEHFDCIVPPPARRIMLFK